MARDITNEMLSGLLTRLGFERERVTDKNNCVWRHPAARTSVVLPANKVTETALQADIISLRAKLDYDGHLDAATFDSFLSEGKLAQLP